MGVTADDSVNPLPPSRLQHVAIGKIGQIADRVADSPFQVGAQRGLAVGRVVRLLAIPAQQKSKLSRRILLLEERLGVRLLNRSSRRFSITEIGREYYGRCAAMLVEAEAAEQVVAQVRAEPRGVIRVSCPIALLSFQFGAWSRASWRRIERLRCTWREPTGASMSSPKDFDMAIRVRFPPLAPSDLVMRQLDQSTQCLVASPKLVAQGLMSPADLVGLPSLDLGPPHREHVWQLPP